MKPLRYLVWKAVVSVWAEGTLDCMSLLRIRQTGSFFSTCYSDHAGHARKNLSRFESVWIFYDFPGRKPLKYCPDVTQRAFVVGFRSFWPWGARAPHALPEVGCNPSNRSGTCCGRRWFRYGRRGPSVARLRFASAKRAQFFSRATVTMQGTHAKICRISSPYGFSTIFRAENP